MDNNNSNNSNNVSAGTIRTPEGVQAYQETLVSEYVALVTDVEHARKAARRSAGVRARKVLNAGIPKDLAEFHAWAMKRASK